MRWDTLVDILLPIAFAQIPGLSPTLIPVIIRGIKDAQTMKDASGEERKQYVLREVEDSIRILNTQKGRVVIDPVKTMPIVGAAIDTGILIVKRLMTH